jgi:hypothetical protein
MLWKTSGILLKRSQDLLVLDIKDIAPPAALDALRRAHKVGQMQFESFV